MIHTSDAERWAKFRLTSVVSPWPDSSLRGPYGTKFFTETSFGSWDYLIKKWRCLSHRNQNLGQELAPCLLGEMSGSKHGLACLWRFAWACHQLDKKVYFLRQCLADVPIPDNLPFRYAAHSFLKNNASALLLNFPFACWGRLCINTAKDGKHAAVNT